MFAGNNMAIWQYCEGSVEERDCGNAPLLSPLSVSTLQANRTEGEGKRVFIADIGRGPLFHFESGIFQRKDAVILLLLIVNMI